VEAMIARARLAREVAVTNTITSVQITTVSKDPTTVSTPKLAKQASKVSRMIHGLNVTGRVVLQMQTLRMMIPFLKLCLCISSLCMMYPMEHAPFTTRIIYSMIH